MVLAPEPHGVVAGFVHPVAIAEDCLLYGLPQVFGQLVAIIAPDPEQRYHPEVRAVLPVDDEVDGAFQDRPHHGRIDLAGMQHGQHATDQKFAILREPARCLCLAFGETGKRRARRQGGQEGALDYLFDDSAAHLELHDDAIHPVGDRAGRADLKARLPGCELKSAIQHHMPLVHVVANDNAHGNIASDALVEYQREGVVDVEPKLRPYAGGKALDVLDLGGTGIHRQARHDRSIVEPDQLEEPVGIALRDVFGEHHELVGAGRERQPNIDALRPVAPERLKSGNLRSANE